MKYKNRCNCNLQIIHFQIKIAGVYFAFPKLKNLTKYCTKKQLNGNLQTRGKTFHRVVCSSRLVLTILVKVL